MSETGVAKATSPGFNKKLVIVVGFVLVLGVAVVLFVALFPFGGNETDGKDANKAIKDATEAYVATHKDTLSLVDGIAEENGKLNLDSLNEDQLLQVAQLPDENAPQDKADKIKKAKQQAEVSVVEKILASCNSEEKFKQLDEKKKTFLSNYLSQNEQGKKLDTESAKMARKALSVKTTDQVEKPEAKLLKALEANQAMTFTDVMASHKAGLEALKKDASTFAGAKKEVKTAVEKLVEKLGQLERLKTQSLTGKKDDDKFFADLNAADLGIKDADLARLTQLKELIPLAEAAHSCAKLEDLEKIEAAKTQFKKLAKDEDINKLPVSEEVKTKLKALLKQRAVVKLTADQLLALKAADDATLHKDAITEAIATADPAKKPLLQALQKEVELCILIAGLGKESLSELKAKMPAYETELPKIVEADLRCAAATKARITTLKKMLETRAKIVAYVAKPGSPALDNDEKAAFKAVGDKLADYDLEAMKGQVDTVVAALKPVNAEDKTAFAKAHAKLIGALATVKNVADVLKHADHADIVASLKTADLKPELADDAGSDAKSKLIVKLRSELEEREKLLPLLAKNDVEIAAFAQAEKDLLDKVSANDVYGLDPAQKSTLQTVINKVKGFPELLAFLAKPGHAWTDLRGDAKAAALKAELARVQDSDLNAGGKLVASKADVEALRSGYVQELLQEVATKGFIGAASASDRDILTAASAAVGNFGSPKADVDGALAILEPATFKTAFEAELDAYAKTAAGDLAADRPYHEAQFNHMKVLNPAYDDAPNFDAFLLRFIEKQIGGDKTKVDQYYYVANAIASIPPVAGAAPLGATDGALKTKYAKSAADVKSETIRPYADLKQDLLAKLSSADSFVQTEVESLANEVALCAAKPGFADNDAFKIAANDASAAVIEKACKHVVVNKYGPIREDFLTTLAAINLTDATIMDKLHRSIALIAYLREKSGSEFRDLLFRMAQLDNSVVDDGDNAVQLLLWSFEDALNGADFTSDATLTPAVNKARDAFRAAYERLAKKANLPASLTKAIDDGDANILQYAKDHYPQVKATFKINHASDLLLVGGWSGWKLPIKMQANTVAGSAPNDKIATIPLCKSSKYFYKYNEAGTPNWHMRTDKPVEKDGSGHDNNTVTVTNADLEA